MYRIIKRNVILLICLSLFLLAKTASARIPPGLLTKDELAWLASHPVIRVGYDADYAPIDMNDDDGRFTGLSRDYFNYFEQTLGVTFVSGTGANWTETYQAAVDGAYDVLSAVEKTPRRQRYFLFTDPYVTNKTAIITTRANQDTYVSMAALEGSVVAIIPGYSSEDILQTNYPNVLYKRTDTIVDGLKEVAFGSVDAFVGNIAPITHYLEEYTITNLAVAGLNELDTQLRFGVRKDWPELVSILNKVIAHMPLSERKALYQTWVSYDDAVSSRYQRRTRLLAMLLLAVVGFATLLWGGNRTLQREVDRRTRELRQLNDSLEMQVAERTNALEQANQQLRESRSVLVDSNQKLQDLAHYDSLTGVANRNYLDHIINEFERDLSAQLPLSVLLIDIDAFKAYNDTYGHPKGDQCLRRVAQTLARDIQRQGEVVARYGGEEFAVILAHHNASQALEIAERKRAEIEQLQIENAGATHSPYVTVSIGVATLGDSDTSIASSIEQADRALYRAKQSGRNRVAAEISLG